MRLLERLAVGGDECVNCLRRLSCDLFDNVVATREDAVLVVDCHFQKMLDQELKF